MKYDYIIEELEEYLRRNERMKKIFLITLLVSILMIFSGCESYKEASGKNPLNEDFGNGYFMVITEWSDGRTYRIVYAKDTKVKYLVFTGDSGSGITPLLNPDGTPQIYLSDD